MEKVFDDVARLASKVCGTPIALVSLVDTERQWFKARHGIDAEEAPRDVSFCGHAILEGGVLEVPDALNDERFFDNPFVSGGPKVRFYAGAPLRAPDGHAIGTLCVIDSAPGKLDNHQREVLASLADHVVALFEMRVAANRVARDDGYLRTLLANLTEGVLVLDAAGGVVDQNDAASRTLGLSREDVGNLFSQKGSWAFVRMDGSPLAQEDLPLTQTFTKGQACRGMPMGIRKASGETRWLSVSTSPLPSEVGRGEVLMTISDVTELRSHQLLFSQAAKMKALGEMAGGVAHEINNPLTIISGFATLIDGNLRDAEVSPALYERELQRIVATSERISVIVRSLKFFSRSGEKEEFVRTDLSVIVRETLLLCSERFRMAGIALETRLTEGALVACRPTQISQVLLNLLNNAFDAVSKLDDRWVRVEVEPLAKGDEVSGSYRIRVSDSGPGIPEALQGRLMQPFFTTKGPGAGAGLGLSVSNGIVEDHGGGLRYENVGGHTSFCVELPTTGTREATGVRTGRVA
jgi:PAS domain S-box-containing protein